MTVRMSTCLIAGLSISTVFAGKSPSKMAFLPLPSTRSSRTRNVAVLRQRQFLSSAIEIRGGSAVTRIATSMKPVLPWVGLSVLLSSFISQSKEWQEASRGGAASVIDGWLWKYNQSIYESMAIALALVSSTNLSPTVVSSLAPLPILLFFWFGLDLKTMEDLGFIRAYRPFMIMYCALMAMVHLLPNASNSLRFLRSSMVPLYLNAPLAMMGLAGYFLPDATADDLGIELQPEHTRTLWVIMSSNLLSFSSLLYALLLGNGSLIPYIVTPAIITALATLKRMTEV